LVEAQLYKLEDLGSNLNEVIECSMYQIRLAALKPRIPLSLYQKVFMWRRARQMLEAVNLTTVSQLIV
jgi:hypothetical protein